MHEGCNNLRAMVHRYHLNGQKFHYQKKCCGNHLVTGDMIPARTKRGRSTYHWKTYGISFNSEDYDKLFELQEGKCYLCGHENTPNRRLAVDHHHKTLKIRGLLCQMCNGVVGWAERIDDLSKVQDYIDSDIVSRHGDVFESCHDYHVFHKS